MIRGDDRAFPPEIGLVKQLTKPAGGVDAARHQHGIAAPALELIARLHVEQDVGRDFLQPVVRREHPLHRSSTLLQLRLGYVRQPAGL
ncbi:MAG: hypothetical protein ACK4VP_06670, partial [Nitrospira sp.]